MDNYVAWVTIPDDMEVPPPYKKFRYPGGLYAACREDSVAGEWVENSDRYDWHGDFLRAIGWEYFNPFNIHGLDDYENDNNWACSYTTELVPVSKKLTDDDKKRINSELDKIIPRGEPTEIDLASMTLWKDGAICEVNYPNGLLELKYNGGDNSGTVVSPQQFKAPIKIELRAKADNEIFFGCGEIEVGLGCHELFFGLNGKGKSTLIIHDTAKGGWNGNAYKKCGVTTDKFMDIELILGSEFVAIRVDGDLRHYSSGYGYIEALKENPEYSMVGTVSVSSVGGSTVTVQSLRVTEI